jgi:cAMP phosphodiesterase
MKIELLGTYGGNSNKNYLTGFLIDDFLAVDAGSLTQALPLTRQASISDILISHSHLDHTLSLPFLADNLFGEKAEPIRVHTTATVIEAMRKHIFNDVVWPDFTVLPTPEEPTICFREITAEKPFHVGHLQLTAIPVNHVVPTVGFLIESNRCDAAILYTADTTNTDRVWAMANACPNLKAVIVDCSFPNEFDELARISGHMTPAMLARDLTKLKRECKVLVYHLKPLYEQRLIRELDRIGHPDLITRLQSAVYEF